MRNARLEDEAFAKGRGADPLTHDNASGFGDDDHCNKVPLTKETIMRDRFLRSMMTVAIAAAAVGGIILVSITRISLRLRRLRCRKRRGANRTAGHLDRRG